MAPGPEPAGSSAECTHSPISAWPLVEALMPPLRFGEGGFQSPPLLPDCRVPNSLITHCGWCFHISLAFLQPHASITISPNTLVAFSMKTPRAGLCGALHGPLLLPGCSPTCILCSSNSKLPSVPQLCLPGAPFLQGLFTTC